MPGPGTPYTMTEMRTIVEYIVEHRAYRDIKARKMWQDLARSGRVNRTWQSLKETFLKRILPDIHNTYYRLTPAQKRSFRESSDVEAREAKSSGRLEMKSVDSDSSGNRNDPQRPSCSKNTGEDNPSKINSRSRTSTDTIVLDNCYETAEQIQMDLESREDTESGDEPQPLANTLRDYIAYSEPLTPMVQEVIDDFATDEDEPQLQIAEDFDDPVNGRANSETPEIPNSPLEIRRSERLTKPDTSPKNNEPETSQKKNEEQNNRKSRSPTISTSTIKSLKLKKTRNGWDKKSRNKNENTLANENAEPINISEETNKTVDKDGSRNGTVLTDTQLPNNQEELGTTRGVTSVDDAKQTSIAGSTQEFQEPNNKKKAVKRARSTSNSGVKRKLRKKTQNENDEINDKLPELLEKENDSLVPASNIDTQTYDSHLNIVANKTSEGNGTFNSHGNQEKLTCENTQTTQNSQNDSKNRNEVAESNPCLQSVSLYDEQFCTTKYSDSENGDPISDSKQTSNKDAKDCISEEMKESNNAKKSKSKDTAELEQTANKKASYITSKVAQDSDAKNCNSSKNLQGPSKSNSQLSNIVNNVPELKNHTQVQSASDVSPTKKNEDIAKLFTQNVLLLKSNSESDESVSQQRPKKVVGGKLSREEALANVFGFASGAVTITSVPKKVGRVNVNPKYRESRRRRTISKNGYSRTYKKSGTSAYSSDSDSEEASHLRKYIPPQSYKILTHKGAKFVTDDNKIYPLVIRENGNMYDVYGSDNDCDAEMESFWKNKYLEERRRLAEETIRADELARLLKRSSEMEHQHRSTSRVSRSKSPMVSERQKRRNDQDETIELSSDVSKMSKDGQMSDKTVKIKLNNKKEIELECNWSHMPSVLEKMASIFQQKDDPKPTVLVTEKVPEVPRTPTPEISAKVDKIESQIFKEIADKDEVVTISDTNGIRSETAGDKNGNKSEKVNGEIVAETNTVSNKNVSKPKSAENEADIEKSDENVTKRKRGRPRKYSSPSTSKDGPSVSKTRTSGRSPKPKTDTPTSKSKTDVPSPKPKIKKIEVQTAIEKEPVKKRSPRVTKKDSEANVTVSPSIRKSRSKSRISVLERDQVVIPDDPNIKYMLPQRSQSDSEAAKGTRRK